MEDCNMLTSKFNAIDFADGAAYGSAPPQKKPYFVSSFYSLLTMEHDTWSRGAKLSKNPHISNTKKAAEVSRLASHLKK